MASDNDKALSGTTAATLLEALSPVDPGAPATRRMRAALLDRIEAEMADAPPEQQWTMNNTLAAIGIHDSEHRERALAIGEELGVFRDYPTSPGCTSPYAPIWINEMVSRQ